MRRLAFLFAAAITLGGCTAAVSAEFPTQTLTRLQELNRTPEVIITGPRGDFMITPDTRVEIFLASGEVVTVFASEILTNNDSVILRGRGATIPLSAVTRVRYTSTY